MRAATDPRTSWLAAVAAVVAVVAAVATGLPSAAFAQEIASVCTSVACVAPSSKPAVRRGTTETLRIRGKGVDINRSEVKVDPRLTIAGFTPSTCGTETCADLRLTVPSGFDLTANLVPVFYKNAAFNVQVVRRGEITSMSQSPAEGVWGENVRVKLTGVDIGNARVTATGSTVTILDQAGGGYGVDSLTFRATGSGNPQLTTGLTVGDSRISNLIGDYRFTTPTRTIKYSAAQGQPECATTPGIGVPATVSPVAAQIFTFASETSPVNASITLTWGPGYQGQFKPTEQFIVEIGQAMADAGTRTTAGTLTPITTIFRTVAYTTGQGIMSRNVSLPRRVQYQWRVKAYNCGMNGAYSAYSKFTVR